MRICFLYILFTLTCLSAKSQEQYVCTPCGNTCDTEIHGGPGMCSHCSMPLVKKAGVRFKDITVDQLCSRVEVNPKAILLDVRSPGEFTGSNKDVPSFGHFKKAININVEELESRIGELAKYKNSEIIVYCSHSHRSPRASYILNTHGFTNVKNMIGGVSILTPDTNPVCLKKIFVIH